MSVEYEREALCLPDTENATPLQRFETFIQDPAGGAPVEGIDNEITGNLTESVTENLTLRVSDENRVTSALVDASKKRKTGSVFSVEVDLSGGEMGLGVKILKNNVLVISMLKRHNRILGPGEAAGLRLGDIIFGANFRPCVEGVRSLLHGVKHSLRAVKAYKQGKGAEGETEGGGGGKVEKTVTEPILRPVITLQCWRCHQLCSDSIPGRLFPRADDVFVQGYSLFRSRVLSEWERWNFNEILLNFLKKELKIRLEDEVTMAANLGANPRIRVIHNEVLDLERNILKAKGLRTALCVRIVHTKFIDDAVLYVLRVEDEESGLQWNVRKRYNDFYALHKELIGLSKYLQDIPFPKKRIVHSRLSLRVIEERIVALEQFIRQGVHRLTQYATSDAQASQSLRRVQDFLDVEMFINCLKPPPLDDQRYLELMTYRRLNDFSSLSCQQCIRFVDSVDLDALAQNDKSNGYLPMLELVAQALREVEQYAIQQYGQQMNQILRDRRPHMSEEKVKSFVIKCVRRQVEGAIYLPLRRAIFRIVYSFIADKAERLQKSMKILKRAPVSRFFEKGDYSEIHLIKSLPLAVEAFRNLVNAFLPSDQGNMLMKAAGAVMTVISDLEAAKKAGGVSNLPSSIASEKKDDNDLPPPPPSVSSPVTKDKHLSKSLNSPKGVEMRSSQVSERRRSVKNKKNKDETDVETTGAGGAFLNDMLSLKTLADPAGTIFSAAEHVLVDRRNFDQDGALGGSDDGKNEDEEGSSENSFSLSLIDDASQHNDAFRELYSILKAESGRGEKDTKQVRKTMRDMAISMGSANTDDNDDPNEGKEVGESRNDNKIRSESLCTDSDNDSVSDSSGVGEDEISEGNIKPPLPLLPLNPSEVAGAVITTPHKESGHDSDADVDVETRDDPSSISLLSPSLTQTLISSGAVSSSSSGAVTAIRGTSVMHLEGGREHEARSLSERVETYTSPFKTKTDVHASPRPSATDGMNFATDERAGGQSMSKGPVAVGADDFLPMFTFVLVQSGLPQLLLVKELMVTLVDNEEMYGECGYYMATLEAATQHIIQMADEYSLTLSHSKIVENHIVEKSKVSLPVPSPFSSSALFSRTDTNSPGPL